MQAWKRWVATVVREKGTSTTQLLPAGWPAARALLAFQEGCGRTACGLVSASGAPLLTALVQTAPPAQHSMHSAAQHAQHITALPQHSTGSPPPSTTLTKVITGCWQLCSARCHCQVGQLITALQPVPQGGACRGVSLCLRACLQAGSPTCSGLGLPPRSTKWSGCSTKSQQGHLQLQPLLCQADQLPGEALYLIDCPQSSLHSSPNLAPALAPCTRLPRTLPRAAQIWVGQRR